MTDGTSEVVVETRELTKRFGDFTAVDRLTLEVRKGEIFGFLGSNGAGKTTAIRMLCGLQRPTEGAARVLGIDVTDDPEAIKRRIGYMSQRFSLYDDLTVCQNLRFFGGVYGLRGERLRERERWAIDMTDLEGKQDLITGSLPVGWKQRLALACALLHEPPLVFLDEPTASVDPISRRDFWRLIRTLASRGTTVFVTTHYLDEAEHCHRLALLHAGQLVAVGTVSELKEIFGDGAVLEVECPRAVEAMEVMAGQDWVAETSIFGTRIHLVVDDPDEARRRTRELLEATNNTPATVERIVPSLEDVFIHHIEARSSSVPGRPREP